MTVASVEEIGLIMWRCPLLEVLGSLSPGRLRKNPTSQPESTSSMLRPEFVKLDSGHYANHRRLSRNRRHAMPDVSNNAMQKLLAFVNELDRRRIHRRLASVREAVMVEVHVPGGQMGRWSSSPT